MNSLLISFFLIIFFVGLSFGSFLNSLIYRLKEHKTILGRSYCPHCKQKIVWYDNIPVFSYLLLNAKCRNCKQKISLQYLLVELTMGIFFVLSFLWVNSSMSVISYQLSATGVGHYTPFILSVIKYWVIFFVFTFIFVYDAKYSMVDSRVVLSASLLVFGLAIFESFLKENSSIVLSDLFQIFLAMIIGVGFFAIQYVITKGKAIGMGDLQIGLFMGASLVSWQFVLVAILLSYIIGAIISLGLILFKQKTIKDKIPLGPFLSIGSVVTIFYGEQIINWFFR
ncbi:prepilin peptidase [Patescibacteria group bacterium]|nr:prepilin peptidase [Patescibacteria group bacterium]